MKVQLLVVSTLLMLSACKTADNKNCVQGEKQPDCVCITIYDPVCGCNNVTYGNSCEANCDGIAQYKKGECKQ